MKPKVVIIGRANVGKSTLFNRIVGARQAIVADMPGITRDRLYRDVSWLDNEFLLIDTGGISFSKEEVMTEKIKEQAEMAISEADAVIFLTDFVSGVSPEDMEIAELLRKTQKPIILAVNKFDNFNDLSSLYEFFALGLGDPMPVSSLHGMNIGDLLDEVVANFADKRDEDDAEADCVTLTFVGRPNVGKSSLVNRILGFNRMIVSDLSGTTRDAVDTAIEFDRQLYRIVDTAGIRKQNKVSGAAEYYSVNRGLKAIDRSDVVVLVLDATKGIEEQDKRIAGYAHEAGKGLLIAVNKWDLPEKETNTMKKYENAIKAALGFAGYALTVFVSAKTGQRVDKILPLANFISEQHSRRVITSTLNDVIREIISLNPPPAIKGRQLKFLYATQVGVRPPKIVIFVNDRKLVHFSYARYIENRLRENFGFAGSPISLLFRSRKVVE